MISKITVMVMLTIAGLAGISTVQAVFADDKNQYTSPFKINVILDGVDSQTGAIKVFIASEDDAYQERIIDPIRDGRAGIVDLKDFVFEANAIPSGQVFDVCVQSVQHPANKACVQGENHKGKHIETVTVPVPIGIGRPPIKRGII